MTYTGEIHNGALVIDGPVALPEGIRVSCLILPLDKAEGPVQGGAENMFGNLMEFAGMAKDLPADTSSNLDHYLYGAAKE